MRIRFSITLIIMVFALSVCAFISHHSRKAIGRSVAALLIALIPPVTGNLIIIGSNYQNLSTVGYYTYFFGMNLVMYALLKFTFVYCNINWPDKISQNAVRLLLVFDAIQLSLNPLLGHAFATEELIVDGSIYYRLIPFAGQSIHRIIDYSIFLIVLLIFTVKTSRTSKIYAERYSVILLVMLFTGVWETYYIFSGRPIDTSMIGFGAFGLLVFYFSLYYRPLRLLDRMLANIASEMKEALFFFDSNKTCIWANSPGLDLVHINEEDFEIASSRLKEMFKSFNNDEDQFNANEIIDSGSEKKYYVLSKQLVNDDDGYPVGSFLSVRDNTAEQLELQKEIFNATHDRLTGLYNREKFFEMSENILHNNPDKDYLAVFADINDFKLVNDVYGNEFGDLVLKKVADLFSTLCPENSIYGRLGGDTFGILYPADQFRIEDLENHLSRFSIVQDELELQIILHIGVYEIVDRSIPTSAMFDRAHMAISTIKEDYHHLIQYYNDDFRSDVIWNKQISSDLHDALRNRDIVPYLQPIMDVEGKIAGAEVLVRWNHPIEGFLSPGKFIPVFEKNGMIADVDRYMWRCACEILRKWKQKNRNEFISINISPNDFNQLDVVKELKELIREYDISASQLRIEITETVMMSDIDKRMSTLSELSTMGFIIEMDDFGSGYSSFNLLKDMEVDVLKIDMVFLRKTGDVEKAKKIVKNIISMANDLNIVPLTEGVETQRQFEVLLDMGCKLFQGFYFAKPMPEAEFEEFHNTHGR